MHKASASGLRLPRYRGARPAPPDDDACRDSGQRPRRRIENASHESNIEHGRYRRTQDGQAAPHRSHLRAHDVAWAEFAESAAGTPSTSLTLSPISRRAQARKLTSALLGSPSQTSRCLWRRKDGRIGSCLLVRPGPGVGVASLEIGEMRRGRCLWCRDLRLCARVRRKRGPDSFFDAQKRNARGQLVEVVTRRAAAGTWEQQRQAALGAPQGIAECRADVQDMMRCRQGADLARWRSPHRAALPRSEPTPPVGPGPTRTRAARGRYLGTPAL